MALVLADRVREGTNTAGTGTVTLTGAVTGFASFANQIGNGNTTYYTITDGTNWEVGVGTYNANTLSRDTVLDSSTGSLINFAAGFKDVFVTLPAEKVASTDTLGTMSTQNANNVAITGGTINGATVGATTPAAGTFTTLTAQTEVLKGTGQNLITYSQDITNGSWTKQRTTATADSTTAPDGTTTADTMTGDGTSGGSMSVNKTFTAIASTPYVLSIYAKASTATWLVIQGFDGSTSPRAWFNVSTGVVGTVESGMSGGAIQSVGNGWYRCSVVRTTGASSTSLRPQYGLGASDGVEATSVTTSLFFWGAQGEFGSTINTYIPTTTTAIYGTPTLSFSGVAGIGLQSDGSLYVQPAGTGAVQAQATTSTATGGNARGANAVDWQTSRSAASMVASSGAVISGGLNNTASGTQSAVSGGNGNNVSNTWSVIGGGLSNTVSGSVSFNGSGQSNTVAGARAAVVTGRANTASGEFNFIGGGYTNSGTATAAVTTQSGTMNGTTAVTLSGSNANIKVGQFVTGTSIASETYVAAISGTSLTLSQAASGSSTSTLSFYTPHGVVVGGGNNQATGSYSFIGGGGDAGTAGNRNVASGDWSTVAGGIKNVASGIGSFVGGGGTDGTSALGNIANTTGASVIGGANSIASGVYSVTGGRDNIADGNRSTAFGASAWTRAIRGNIALSACQNPIGGSGVSQAAILILGKETTNATPTVLASNSGTAGSDNQVILPNNSAYYFKGTVVAGVTGGGNTKGWTVEGVIKRGANAASTAIVGTATVVSAYADAGAATWALTATADTTNGGLAVTFTGQAGTTIRTVAKIETTEMTY